MNDIESKKITILLEKSRNAGSQDYSSLLQQEGIDKIKSIMKEKYSEACKYDPTKDFDRRHDSITVLGSRGAGKTTFLLSLEKIVPEVVEDDAANSLLFLDVIDPTLYEKKENILVSLCAAMIEKMNEDQLKDHEWQKSLRNLARGFSLLDNVGSNPMQEQVWDDIELLMGIGIDNARAGLNFEKNFHNFINESLRLFGKKLLIIRFDDIDTNFERGWEILETIRKYLTSPQILVIMAGDWDLYYRLVGEHQKKVLQTDEESLDLIVEQYLTKIFKPEYRYIMQTIKNLREKGYCIQVRHGANENSSYSIEEILGSISEELLHRKDDIAINIFMSLPVRLVIQILYAYDKCRQNDRTDTDNFFNEINLIFMTYLLARDFAISDLNILKTKIGFTEYANKIIAAEEKQKNGALEVDFRNLIDLEYQYIDRNTNLLYLLLKSNLLDSMQNDCSKFFEWYFRIRILEACLSGEQGDISKNESLKYLQFRKYITILESSRQMAGFSEKYKPNIYASTYLHHQRKPKDNNYLAWDEIKKFIGDKLPENERKTMYNLVNIAGIYVIKKKHSEITLMFGILNILGWLASFLRNEISECALYSIYAYGESSTAEVLISKVDEPETGKYENCNNELIEELKEWKNAFSDKVQIPSIELLNAFWEEFLIKIEESAENQENMSSVGDFIALQIHIFLNTLLRKSGENTGDTYRIIASKGSMQDRLKTNIQKSNFSYLLESESYKRAREMKSVSLFEMMYLCPLWDYYCDLKETKIFDVHDIIEPELSYFQIFNRMALHAKRKLKQEEKTSVQAPEFDKVVKQCIKSHEEALRQMDLENIEDVIDLLRPCVKTQFGGKKVQFTNARKELIREMLSEYRSE